jgi:hypothetical protein
MGIYQYEVRCTFPEGLSDQEVEDRESVMCNQGLDPDESFTYAYDRSDAKLKYTQEQAREAAHAHARKIRNSEPDIDVKVARVRFCLCCPKDTYEVEPVE